MLKLLNWWPNLYRENDPDEMSDAWAVSLTDVPYDAAMAGAVALSRTMTWPPAVAEICEAAKPYIGFQPDLMNVRVAIDAYEELGLPLPPWFYAAAQKYAAQIPPDYQPAALLQGGLLNGNNRKDPRRQLIGAVSKALGQQFERDINAAFDHYRRLGVASIEKTPEPFHMTGRENGGKVVGFYEKKAQPDYAGTLRGGRSVYMEAKFTGSNRMEQSRVSPGQTEYLDEKMRVGAFCYVLAGFSHGGAYCIPWSVWRSMKEHYGRKYITENDITQYKIPRTTTGMLAILGTGKE